MNIPALILSIVLVTTLIVYGIIASKSDIAKREVKLMPLLIGLLVTTPLAIMTLIKAGNMIPGLFISYIGAIILSIIPATFKWFAAGDALLYMIGANVFTVSSAITNENNVVLYLMGMAASYLFQVVNIIIHYEKRKKEGLSEEEAKVKVIETGVEFFPGITFGNIIATILTIVALIPKG